MKRFFCIFNRIREAYAVIGFQIVIGVAEGTGTRDTYYLEKVYLDYHSNISKGIRDKTNIVLYPDELKKSLDDCYISVFKKIFE